MFLSYLAIAVVTLAESLITYSTWNWFIVPLGTVPISFAQMLGVQIAIRFFKPRRLDTEELFQHVGTICIISVVVLGLFFALSRFV